jgi:hypothetical protein
MTRITRREGLLAGLFGGTAIGLRALATGLPAWYLLNPSRATAQDLQCAITARTNLQYLIVSVSSNGDPLNCNCPGTYEGAGAAVVHPPQEQTEKATVQLGAASFGAALPWASTDVKSVAGNNTGQLKRAAAFGTDATGMPATFLNRTAFFHYRTGTTVHGDQPKVMKLLGDTTGGEMVVSAYAKHLSACFGTVQAAPIAVGARGNASELVSFGGRMLPSISPTQLKQLLTGARGDALTAKGALRDLRDASLNKLNELAKRSSSDVQKQFLDKLALGQTQVRQLADTLADTLNMIQNDNVAGQAQAAAALIAANVTPVVTVRISFGGDNHTDGNLQAESDQHVSGIQGIQAIMDALAATRDAAGNPLTDRVTFATMNVFGRNLNNISKLSSTTSPGGRDHFGNHNVMVIVGKNVKPSVIGGVVADSKGTLVASGIDSATGASAATGGDIDATKTQVSAARTLGAALGIPDALAANDYIGSAGGKVVTAALANLPSA